MTQPIPFHDFGGRGRPLHFAHANAYPPGSYRAFIDPLLPHYRVIGLHHRPLWPGSRPAEVPDWGTVADDLIHFLEQEQLAGVVGAGHSLGAVATMFAALKRPDLFRALVLIEPVFLPPHILAMAAANGEAMALLPLVATARKRRQHWPDRATAFAHFRRKEVFARWPDETLWDYVNYGLVEKGGEVRLAYRREWEAHFYALPPTTVWEDVANLRHPTLAIRGAESDTITPAAWQLWQARQPAATFVELADSGHMVTMERPSALAQTILEWLATSDVA